MRDRQPDSLFHVRMADVGLTIGTRQHHTNFVPAISFAEHPRHARRAADGSQLLVDDDVYRFQLFQRVEHVGVGAWEIEHRSEEHTSELQSQSNLVCRLLLEKKKQKKT